jgi:hypothetical protein
VQAKPVPPRLRRGEERLKRAVLHLGAHADAVVNEFDLDLNESIALRQPDRSSRLSSCTSALSTRLVSTQAIAGINVHEDAFGLAESVIAERLSADAGLRSARSLLEIEGAPFGWLRSTRDLAERLDQVGGAWLRLAITVSPPPAAGDEFVEVISHRAVTDLLRELVATAQSSTPP